MQNMKAKQHPTQEILREYFDVADGKFVRRIKTGPNTRIGEVVNGYVVRGRYLAMKFNNSHFQYHRLIWIYFNGLISENINIDHIDGNILNNDISNLRLATNSQNAHNSRINKNNTSGYKDIVKYSKTKNGVTRWYYYVRVKLNGVFHSKNFPCTVEGLKKAIEHRDYLISTLHGEFGRTF